MLSSSSFEKIIYGVKFCTEVPTLLKTASLVFLLAVEREIGEEPLLDVGHVVENSDLLESLSLTRGETVKSPNTNPAALGDQKYLFPPLFLIKLKN